MMTVLYSACRFAGRGAGGAGRPEKVAHGPIRLYAGRSARGLVAMLLLALPVQYAAAIQWDRPWSVQSNGQRLSVETFSSQMSPDAVARELARLNGAYERYLVGDGRILLSGLKRGEHWLAEIQARPDGSHGYVSALYFDAARADASSVAAAGLGAGGLKNAVQRLSDAGLGSPLRVFEFESSALVGVVALPTGELVAPSLAGVDTGPAVGGHGEPADGQAAATGFSLMPAEAPPGMALAVSLPEP